MDLYQKPKWVEAFSIDDATWETLCSQAARLKFTPLDIALDMGLFNENKLAEWAREISGLVSVKTVFFNGDPPLELLKSQNYHKCRESGCMPIASWDGICYWAKLSNESTGLENEFPNAIWVLAPWSGLKKWFSLWENSVTSRSEAATVVAFHSPVIETEIEFPMNPPAGINSEDSQVLTAVDFSQVMVPVSSKAIAEPIRRPDFSPKEESASQLPSFSPPIPGGKIATASIPPAPSMPMTAPSGPAIQVPIAPIPVDQINAKLGAATSLEVLTTTVLGGWKSQFDKVMILLFQANQLIIWRWNGDWSGKFDKGVSISLDSPSIFKIVVDTGSPYHGYVARGPINEAFFNQTDSGLLPEHITIVPVIAENKVAAMLVGIGSKSAAKTVSLTKLEENAFHFARGLIRFMGPMKRTG